MCFQCVNTQGRICVVFSMQFWEWMCALSALLFVTRMCIPCFRMRGLLIIHYILYKSQYCMHIFIYGVLKFSHLILDNIIFFLDVYVSWICGNLTMVWCCIYSYYFIVKLPVK